MHHMFNFLKLAFRTAVNDFEKVVLPLVKTTPSTRYNLRHHRENIMLIRLQYTGLFFFQTSAENRRCFASVTK